MWAKFPMRALARPAEHGHMTNTYMSQDQILDIGQKWAAAERYADIATLDSLLDADFACVGPLGFVLNKDQYLAGRRSGDLKQESFAWQDIHVRVYGNAAIAIGSQIQKTTYQGRDASGQFRVTQVFTRKDEGWLLTSLHLSPIADAMRRID
jgi:ketosteroid isomerase-like protein